MMYTSDWNEIFRYDKGVLYWKISPNKGIDVGATVGSETVKGYLQVQYKKKVYRVHRIIWEIHYGPIPEGMQIDHISHDRKDNRIENLRLVTPLDNAKNRTKQKRNKSGQTGVIWSKRYNKWIASIRVNTKYKHLGSFTDIDEAIKARKDAEILYDYHPNHGK